jgi:serine/threonine-protein kinase
VARVWQPPRDRSADERRRAARARRRGWLALLLVLLLTTAAAVTGWYYTNGRFTSAPELSSLTRTQAEQLASGAGLGVVFEPEFSESVAPGVVISASPGTGEPVLKSGQIAAAVSQGPERYPMPRVVGLTEAAAKDAVEQANLELGRVRTTYSETAAKGEVTKSSQPAGAKLRKQALVSLTVSLGPRPITIASFTRLPVVEAEAALTKAGFQVAVTTANSATVPAGRVISQSPERGTGKAGDTITLTRSLGPVLVTVPNVKRQGIKAATQAIQAAGFKVRTRPVPVNFLGLGYVSYSRPGAGSRAPQGSTITLYTV